MPTTTPSAPVPAVPTLPTVPPASNAPAPRPMGALRRRGVAASAVILLGALAAGLAAPTAADAEGQAPGDAPVEARAITPAIVLTGHAANGSTEQLRIARSRGVFAELWSARIAGAEASVGQSHSTVPEIDFGHYEALFIFGGDISHADGYRVASVRTERDATRVIRVERLTYQTGFAMGDEAADVPATRPWAMVLLPRTDATVIVEENRRGMRGPDRWVEWAAFPGRIGVGRIVPGSRQRGTRD